MISIEPVAIVLQHPRWPWRYHGSNARDLRLDFLRGYCLLAMLINHLVVARSWFYAVSGREVFYVSAAEGFYCISGVVLGMTTARLPLGAAARRVLRRALILFGMAIAIALGFAALGLLTDLRLWYDVQTELPRSRTSTLRFVLSVLTLHESFHGAQILVLYIVYLLITPLALLACADGKGWIVLVVSGLVYLISQVYPAAVALPFAAYFSPAAWQPLFFGGLVIGYYRVWIAQTRWWP